MVFPKDIKGKSVKFIRQSPAGVKASVALFLGTIVTKALGYLTAPIYTRLLTPGEYGQVAVYQTWERLFSIFATFCFANAVFNNGMSDYPNKRDEYSLSMLGLSNVITLFFSVILIAIYPFVSGWLGLPFPLILLMIANCFFQPAYNFWMTRQRYELKYKNILFWTITLAFFSPIVAILMIVLFSEYRLYARLFGGEGTLILVYFAFAIYLFVKNHGAITTKYWRGAFLFNIQLIPHYLSVLILGSSDRIMISKLIGDAETAYYTIAYSVAMIVTIVWSAVNSSLVPFTYEKCKVRNFKPISLLANFLLLVFAGFSVLICIMAPEVLRMMATAEYYEAVYVIPPLIVSVFFQVLYYVFSNVVYYFKKPGFIMMSSVFSAVLNIILNYIFIPVFGYIAAAYVTLVCYMLQAMLDYIVLRHTVGESIYNIKNIAFISAGLLVIMVVMQWLYSYAIIRYIMLILLLTILLNRRNIFVNTYKVLAGKANNCSK